MVCLRDGREQDYQPPELSAQLVNNLQMRSRPWIHKMICIKKVEVSVKIAAKLQLVEAWL